MSDNPYAQLVRSALDRTGRAVVKAAGTSMSPTIAPGSAVTLAARPFDAIRPGDVIAFCLGPDIFVHRVAERDRDRLLTIGDNMPLFDPPVGADGYLGCAEGIGAPPPGRNAPPGAAADLTGTTIWTPRPPADRSLAARLAALGATLRTADWPALPALLERAPQGARVGLSSAGAGVARSIPALLGGAGHLLVGYRFGGPRHAATGCLPPDLVDHHVRADTPLREVSLDHALGVIAATFAGYGVRAGEGSAS
ncbi:S24/S26 family peptidase [Dactylosporangium sp. CA-092794]|uniref:S24/S26 family peptidase n=1 Tax=Dactylosporangium sp. CA-092794 TaxID=3239929 RepID=UPI003D91B1B0